MTSRKKVMCEICKTTHRKIRSIPLKKLNPHFLETLNDLHPDIEAGYICLADFNKLTLETIKDNLEEDKGDLSKIEEEVVESLADNEVISENINELYQEQLSFGDKLADKISEFGGSWHFIIFFLVVMLCWVILNTYAFINHFDPYPFILLNLLLSTLAALQAPIILMSQNRQAEKDRFAAEQDYKTNLKAELQIQEVNQKLNNLIDNQITSLLENQEAQFREIKELKEKA